MAKIAYLPSWRNHLEQAPGDTMVDRDTELYLKAIWRLHFVRIALTHRLQAERIARLHDRLESLSKLSHSQKGD